VSPGIYSAALISLVLNFGPWIISGFGRRLFVSIPKGTLNYCLPVDWLAVETKCCLDKFLHRWNPGVVYGKGRSVSLYFTARCRTSTALHLEVVKDIREPAPQHRTWCVAAGRALGPVVIPQRTLLCPLCWEICKFINRLIHKDICACIYTELANSNGGALGCSSISV